MIKRWYDRVIVTLVVTAFSTMLIAALLGTLTRYMTFLPVITWGEEVTRFAGIWSVFLVSGLSVRHGAHFGVDVLTRMLRPQAQRIGLIAIDLVMMSFVLIIIIYGIRVSLDNLDQYSPALQWRIGLVYLCMPIGGVLMAIELVGVIRRTLGGDPPHPPIYAGAPE